MGGGRVCCGVLLRRFCCMERSCWYRVGFVSGWVWGSARRLGSILASERCVLVRACRVAWEGARWNV